MKEGPWVVQCTLHYAQTEGTAFEITVILTKRCNMVRPRRSLAASPWPLVAREGMSAGGGCAPSRMKCEPLGEVFNYYTFKST